MKKTPLVLSLIGLILAIVIFVFADGLRRYYSGGFFLIMAIVLFISSRPGKGPKGTQSHGEDQPSVEG
ncbi:hypothetical protein ACFL5M_00715 [Candidatus Neomarinimicrobiota bacterium]